VCDWVQLQHLELRYGHEHVEQESVMNRNNRNRLRDHHRRLHQDERRQILTALLRLLDNEQDAISSDVNEDHAPISPTQPVTLKRLQ
jgi:hypothetical protein